MFTNDVCAAGQTSADTFKVGGILPLTGNLAFLGPPEIAGVGLAVSEINAAGGVNGARPATTSRTPATPPTRRSRPRRPATWSQQAVGRHRCRLVQRLAERGRQLHGTRSSRSRRPTPRSTCSGYSPFYFRTAPPDGIQGEALGTLISTDGYTNVGFLVFNDTYGTGLRDVVQATVEAAGGECVYG